MRKARYARGIPVLAALTCAVAASVAVATTALGAPARAAGTLALSGTIEPEWRFGDYCGAEVPSGASCVRFLGTAFVPGLGRVTARYTKIVDDPLCARSPSQPVLQMRSVVLEVANKGSIRFAIDGPVCAPTAPASTTVTGTVVGGEGLYAGASGRVRLDSMVFMGDFGCGPCGRARDNWSGTLTVPGLEFDTESPVLSGAVSRTVRAPRGAKRARVRFAVNARDAVDGATPAVCAPRSGSFFRLGRTKVTCSATDTSGNTRTASFQITVKPKR